MRQVLAEIARKGGYIKRGILSWGKYGRLYSIARRKE